VEEGNKFRGAPPPYKTTATKTEDTAIKETSAEARLAQKFHVSLYKGSGSKQTEGSESVTKTEPVRKVTANRKKTWENLLLRKEREASVSMQPLRPHKPRNSGAKIGRRKGSKGDDGGFNMQTADLRNWGKKDDDIQEGSRKGKVAGEPTKSNPRYSSPVGEVVAGGIAGTLSPWEQKENRLRKKKKKHNSISKRK